ncbi:MAG: DUF1647 domain-containing protein [Actinobacteria bacterium]|uniref:Unannotated protein n=1 Tax=freshwater metagenome TaxID=449393 RepID=A0A6J6EDR8_9ZZZZ|nr:DUF1647 domain-containing protein [Actinomycetota bacterium]
MLFTIKMIVFVSACNQLYINNWLECYKSIRVCFPESDIHFFDLGCDNPNSIQKLDKVIYHYFDFSEYPEWVHINSKPVGQWAWKSVCVKKIKNILILEGKSDTTLIWSDSANIFSKISVRLDGLCKRNGLFSNYTSGSVETWTIDQTIDILDADKFRKLQMRNAAYIGFYLGIPWVSDFIDEWELCCINKEIIAPFGSDRSNHRQDQSVLTILYYRYSEIYKFNTDHIDCGVLIHQKQPERSY